MEISECTKKDEGTYKLVVKNEKGEATSQEVTILDLPDPEPEKGEKPQIVKGLIDVVCI